jgi:3-methyladenine DNA glycosylase AlkD
MARYGIKTTRAFGVPMPVLNGIARRYRGDHRLALALWRSGYHEARLLAVLIDAPDQVTEAQMNAWTASFDSWDLCDQACAKLFVRTRFVETAILRWAADDREFVRRAAFALIAAHAVHAKEAPARSFARHLELIERVATDERNFVRKAVNWALRQIGKRSLPLRAAALAVAERLAKSDNAAARWVGKGAVGELTDPTQLARLKARRRR